MIRLKCSLKFIYLCNFLKNVNLIIICLSLTNWVNFSNDLLFFALLLGQNIKSATIRATISGHTKIAFSAASSFSTHCVPQNRCGNFSGMLLFRYVLSSRRVRKNFSHCFHDFINFPITCIDTSIKR